MRNDSGVKSATGLTGSGTRDWIMQRISAVVLAVYSIVVIGFLLIHGQVTYYEWAGFMMSLPMRLFSLLAILALAAHAWVGIWTVLTDYIKTTGTRIALQALMILTIIIYLFWGVMIFWGRGIIT